MPGIVYPDINGVRTSFCSIEFGVEAIRLTGVKALNYRTTHDIPKVRGTSSKALGRVRGEEECEGDIEIYQADWKKLLPVLTVAGAFGFAERSVPCRVVYAELLSPLDIQTDILMGVRIHSADNANSQGPDALTVKLGLSIMDIIYDGKYFGLRPR